MAGSSAQERSEIVGNRDFQQQTPRLPIYPRLVEDAVVGYLKAYAVITEDRNY